MARICCGSSEPRTRTTIEADGSGVSRENSGRSGSTRWTRAAWIAVDGADGAGEFALQRAQMIDVLDEAGGAERVGFVEDLVADAAALGQAALGELHAQPGDLVLWHHDHGAVVAQLEGDRLAFQVLDDGGGVSMQRSVNSVVICGVVTRMMTNAKKPISAAVTATIAIRRAAPRPFRKPTRLCKPTAPEDSARGADWAIIAYGMVSIWLTRVKSRGESSHMKKIGLATRADLHQIRIGSEGLLAILLDAGGAQSGQAMLIDGELPGQEFVDRQGVAAAGLLKGEQAAADRGNDFGLAADDPPFGSGRGQIRNR